MSDAMRELIVARARERMNSRGRRADRTGRPRLRDAALARVRDGTDEPRRSTRGHRGGVSNTVTPRPPLVDRHALPMARRRSATAQPRKNGAAHRAGRRHRRAHCCQARQPLRGRPEGAGTGAAPESRTPQTSRCSHASSQACCAPACRSRPRWTCWRQAAKLAPCGGMPRIVGALARDITAGLRFSAAVARAPSCSSTHCIANCVRGGRGRQAPRPPFSRESPTTATAPPRNAQKCAAALTLSRSRSCCWRCCNHRSVARLGRPDLQNRSSTDLAPGSPAPTQFVLALSSGVATWSVPAIAVIVAAPFGCDVSPATFGSGAHPLRAPVVENASRRRVAARTLCAAAGAVRSAPCCRSRHAARRCVRLALTRTPPVTHFSIARHVDIAVSACGAANGLPRPARAARCFPATRSCSRIAVAEESGAPSTQCCSTWRRLPIVRSTKIGTLSSLCEPLVILGWGRWSAGSSSRCIFPLFNSATWCSIAAESIVYPCRQLIHSCQNTSSSLLSGPLSKPAAGLFRSGSGQAFGSCPLPCSSLCNRVRARDRQLSERGRA